MMRKLLIGVGGLIVLILAAVCIIPFLVPSSLYKERIETVAETALGRNVDIDGDIKLSVFPRIQARASGARIDNPEGFGETPFATMSDLKVAVKLWPLLSRQVEVDEFILIEPELNLVRLPDGRDNWTFSPLASGAPDMPAPTPDEPSERPNEGAGGFSAKLGDVRLVDGAIRFEDRQSGETHELKDLNIAIGMQAMDRPITLDGDGIIDDIPFDLDFTVSDLQALSEEKTTALKGQFTTNLVSAELEGEVTPGQVLSLDLGFAMDIPEINTLTNSMKLAPMPIAEALGGVRAKGRASGAIDDLSVKIDELSHEGGLFQANGQGAIKIGDVIQPNLELSISTPSLQRLAALSGQTFPAAEALGEASLSVRTSGDLDNLTLSDLVLKHDSRLLKITLDAEASMKGLLNDAPDIRYSGPFSLSAPDLRKLTELLEIELPKGDVYRAAGFSGTASGNLTSLSIKNAKLDFDDITATGGLFVDMNQTPMKISGTLTTDKADVTPYAVASNAVQEPDQARKANEWESAPLDLGVLDTIELDASVAVQDLTFQFFKATDTSIKLTIEDGALVANLEKMKFYNGAGSAKLNASKTNGVPTLSLSMSVDDLSAQPFMKALADLNLVQGVGDLKLNFEGTGATMSDLISTLSGAASFNLQDGAIQGVNLQQLNTLSVESLMSGEWRNVLSQDASTKVQNFTGNFDIANGEAVSKDFVFKTGQFRVPGSARMNLAKRSLALTFAPVSNDTSKGLNGEYPPVTFTGPWGGDMNVSLDQTWLQTKLRNAAESAVKDEIVKQIGGDPKAETVEDALRNRAQGLIKDAIGIKPTPTPTPTVSASPVAATPQASPSPEPSPSPSPSASPKSLEDVARDQLKKELGRLFE